MDHLLMALLLLWSSGLQPGGKYISAGAECETTAKADIVMLLDSSGSISPDDYVNMKAFVANLVRSFIIGPDRVQIGLVQYSYVVNLEWHLNFHQTKDALLGAINRLRQIGGRTRTGRALRYILQSIFRPEVRTKPGSQRIVILITDGVSRDDVIATSRKLKDAGIEIYAIGVHGVKERELRLVVSDPKENHLFIGPNFSFLFDLSVNFSINLCSSISASIFFRLVDGTGLCSGRLEVKSNQWNQSDQSWSSVYVDDFDQQDAEVVCRELGCGAPSVLQGELYGGVEAPVWTKEFQCGGQESALLDCGTSDSARNSSSPGEVVGLTCSEPSVSSDPAAFIIRLVLLPLILLSSIAVIYRIYKPSRGQQPNPQENMEEPF